MIVPQSLPKESLPKEIHLVEVGPRDGLQNEPNPIATEIKVELINRLSQCGLATIECSGFVSPKAVPQLADASEVLQQIQRLHTQQQPIQYSALVPNIQGWERAQAAKVDAIALFTAVSETFTQNNIRCSIDASLQRFEPIIAQAQQHHIPIRAYISCAFGCPYEGSIDINKVVQLAERLFVMGCEQIVISDTIGVGTPLQAQTIFSAVADRIGIESLAAHFHDTYGQALANILAILPLGVTTIDCAIAGLGGCPYAPGASGNVATEDVLYMLEGLGIQTGVNLKQLVATSHWLCQRMQRKNNSKVSQALTKSDAVYHY